MSRKKGKARQRMKDWQLRDNHSAGDAAPSRSKIAPNAAKIPAWRQEGGSDNLDALPRREAMVTGLFPGGVITIADGQQLICGVAGTFRPPAGSTALAVGDIVTVAMTRPEHVDAHTADNVRADGMILSRAKRRTMLARPEPRSGKHRDEYEDTEFLKVIVANMDQLVVVAATRQPAMRQSLIERFWIIAQRGEMTPLLVVNKTDIAPPDAEILANLATVGITPILVSAQTGAGMDELRSRLAGKKSVLAGASGVGKSSLVNAIVPGAAAVTNTVRMKDQRGRHTTASAVVYNIADGLLIDTPGVRELAIKMELTELTWYFPEFEALSRQCRFNDCTHLHEPQCAVKAAVDSGALSPLRYESYLRLAETLGD
ncbi:MAG: ribosome small subunit-dependent GTPase A [Planctomycetaceae bacterium]|nr:MAG: ribosome small subunit-dependent GTPase A [Planctomycetaceae bacterium]